MAITISGQNNNDKILASDGVLDSISGFNVVGVMTAAQFDVTGKTTIGHLNIGSNIQIGNAGIITATTLIGNVTGNINHTSNLLLQISGSEKFRVGTSGQLGIGGANYGTSGQVLTSGGSGSAATWTTINLSAVTGATGDFSIADKIVHTGDTNTVIRFPSDDTISMETAGDERFRITSAGKIGIGTNNPKQNVSINNGRVSIDVRGDYYGAWIDGDSLGTSAFNVGRWHNAGGRMRSGGSNDNDLVVETQNTLHNLQLQPSGGDVGIGESSSIDARLHVNSGTDNATLFLESTDGDVNLCMADNAGSCRLLQAGGNLRFRTGGNANAFGTGDSEKMVLDGNGRLLIGTTTEGLTTYGENLTIGSVGHAGITIRTGTGNKGTVYFSDGTSGAAEFKGSIQYDHSDDSLRLAAGGSVRLRVESTGEVRMLPATGGNTTTQFSFNNIAGTPFISIKSNNVNEAAELRVEESSGGASWVFKNKNLNSLLHTHLKIDPNGAIHTAEDGNVKSYPIIMGMYTQHDAHEGQLNHHSLMGPTAGIGGWVFLGHDYGPNPYPVRTFKIAVPEGGNSAIGTRVYQLWHNGDANYDYGGLYEIRINQWNNSSRFESVSIRCINGKRDDVYVVAYNNTNGIMVRTSTIWGSVYLRLAGWDENQVKRGSSYCAVQNNGALAIYNSQGTDDGTPPTSGSPYNVYCFDASSHTGGRDIENNNNFAG